MNYLVRCSNEKEAYNLFHTTIRELTPIEVNMSRMKIIFSGDTYQFVGKLRYKQQLENFIGETISGVYFYEKWIR
ncbi:MAG: hypothetical protein PHW47_07105 [Lachnospira sp.]|nr:hypothetical protein [Lachnospira sp.]